MHEKEKDLKVQGLISIERALGVPSFQIFPITIAEGNMKDKKYQSNQSTSLHYNKYKK